MLIKHQALMMQLKKNLYPIYILTGSDNYLLEDAARQIKTAYKKINEHEEQKLTLQSLEDWQDLFQEANSYSIFADKILIDAHFEKKTIDAKTKALLGHYVESPNLDCLIILRLPWIPLKQLQWLTNCSTVSIINNLPLDSKAMRSWIVSQLNNHNRQFDPQVPEFIEQYTESNMLACAQALDKILLTSDSESRLTLKEVSEELIDQSAYSLFDLPQACLLADKAKAVEIIRYSAQTQQAEAPLVLWVLSNEIRTWLQLLHLLQQGKDFQSSCSEVKIWSSKIGLYQKMQTQMNIDTLNDLLLYCKEVDEAIKTGASTRIWHQLESIALSLCIGKLSGILCKV